MTVFPSSMHQACVQISFFMDSDVTRWSYCNLLPQSLDDWKAVTALELLCQQALEARRASNTSCPVETHQAACQLFSRQAPAVEALLLHHVRRTARIPFNLQLKMLPPSVHAAVCAVQLSELPCGQRHLSLDVSDAAVWAFAAAALPQVQGLESLQLIAGEVPEGHLGPSHVSCLTGLTALRKLDLTEYNRLTDKD
jgi:hypothetical protein